MTGVSSDKNESNLVMRAVNRIEFGENFDVKFIFPNNGGAVLLAEKFQLANISEVFEKQFASSRNDNDGENTEQISIRDISYETFIKLVKHIYKRPVNINEQNFLEILYASMKYFVEDLTFKVIEFIKQFLNAENLSIYFESIDKFEIKMLSEHIKQICKVSPVKIIENLTTSVAHKRILKIILKSPNLPCSEYELYVAIVEMLKRHFNNTTFTDEDFRKELGKLIYLIRFPTMSIKELVLCGKNPSLLTAKQLVDFQLWAQEKIFSLSLQFFSAIPRNVQSFVQSSTSTDKCYNCRGSYKTCTNTNCRRNF